MRWIESRRSRRPGRASRRELLTWSASAALLWAALGTAPLGAQVRSALDHGGAILSAGEELAYLRARALLDSISVPLTIQPFGAATTERLRAWAADADGPWRPRFTAAAPPSAKASPRRLDGLSWQALRPDGALTYHSALPLSRNDGAAWAGRGLTSSLQGGINARWRAVEVQLAPVIFLAQNAEFSLAPNGRTGTAAYADARYPRNIDAPQAFGADAYGRLDPGDSFVRVDLRRLSFGVSTARMTWGPAREYPLVMSTNAGGFTHVFVGSNAPVNIGIGHLQARLIGGRIEQSPYSPVDSAALHRFTSGFVASFSPRFFPGLEIGGTRVMQVRWPAGGPSLSQILRPFQTVVSDQQTGAAPNQNDENQFASAFIRFAPPNGGLEFYGELSREDFTGNVRALIAKPDDLAQFVLGVTRSALRADGSMRVLRAELVNGELSHHERGQRTLARPIPSYTHSQTRQGLTSKGQILGSPVAYGGAGALIAMEIYRPEGRRSVMLERQLRLDWLPALGLTGGTRHAETLYGLRYERQAFMGGRDWTLTVAPSRVLNRHLIVGNDLWNLEVGARWRGW